MSENHRLLKDKRSDTSILPGRKAMPHVIIEMLEERRFLSFAAPAIYSTGVQNEPSNVHLNSLISATTTTLPEPIAISPGSTISPGPLLTTLTPTFSWQAVAGATFTGYQVNLYDVTTTKFVSYQVGMSDTSFTTPTLVAGNTYVWNVRVVNGTQSGLPNSNNYFRTPAAQVVPEPIAISPGSTTSPGPLLTTLTPTFSWQAVTGTTFTGYQVNLYDVTTTKFESYQVGMSDTSFTTPTLTAGNTYVWNVRVVNGTQSGLPNSNNYFQTPAAQVLPEPIAISPGSTTSPGPLLTTLTPTFSWQAVTGATFTGYQVNLYDVTTTKFVSYQVGKSETSFTTPTLTAGNTYVWNVRVVNGTQSGLPNSNNYFQTPTPQALPEPIVISPGSTTSPGPVLTTLTPTFSWQAVTGATFTGYQVNLYDVTTTRFVSYQVGKSETSFTTPTLLAGNTYVWNVRVVNGTQSGLPNSNNYFQTPAAQSLPEPIAISPGSTTSPGPVLTTLTPTFAWQAVTGVTFTGYQINLYDVTTTRFVSYKVGTSETSFTPPTLTAGNTYVWNVRVVNGNQSGLPNSNNYFQIPAAQPLPKPIAVSPGSTTSPGPVLTTLAPTFSWQAVTGVTFTRYQINLYDVTTTRFVSYQVGKSETTFTTPTLIAGNTYVWNVRVVDGTQSGLPNSNNYFQTPVSV